MAEIKSIKNTSIYDSLKDFFYWNSIFIINIFGVFKDIKNYFYLRRSIKKISKTKIWKSLKFKRDWYGMPYTAINYNEEFFDLDFETRKKFVVRDIAQLFKLFEEYNFWEILTLKIERIDEKEVYAVRVWFRPIFYFISFKNFFLTVILILLINYMKNIEQ
jgi:hypothetical protein